MKPEIILVATVVLLTGTIAYELMDRGPSLPASPMVPLPPTTVAGPAIAGSDDSAAQWATTSLARPLFNTDRRPAAGGTAAVGDAQLPRLAGIVISPAGRHAVFATDTKPLISAEGGQVGAYTVRTIEPGVVTIAGPRGTIALRPAFGGIAGTSGGPSLGGVNPPQGAMPRPQAPAPSGLDIIRNLGGTPTGAMVPR